MSNCILSRQDATVGNLPPICMRCGEAATVMFPKKFAWHPSWVYLLLFFGVLPMIIAIMFTTWRMNVPVPFCDRHHNHFSFRNRFAGLGFLAIVGAFFIILFNIEPVEVRMYMLQGLGILLIIWFITICYQGQTAIRPLNIDAQTITLPNVHKAFTAAAPPAWREYPTDTPPSRRQSHQVHQPS